MRNSLKDILEKINPHHIVNENVLRETKKRN